MALTSLTNLQPLHVHSVGVSTFDGSVSVGGTLTYEDVTNVDAIGIITARSGINVSGGQLDVGSNIKLGNAGVITATKFVGPFENITIDDYIIHAGDTNTKFGFPAVDQFSVVTAGDTRFHILSNGNIGINDSTLNALNECDNSTTITPVFSIKGLNENDQSGVLRLTRKDNANSGSAIYNSGDDGGLILRNLDSNGITFYNGIARALRIKPDGLIGIGTAVPTHNFDIVSSSNTYIKLMRTGHTPVYIGALNGGDGVIEQTGHFRVKVGGNERLYLDSTGYLQLKTTSANVNADDLKHSMFQIGHAALGDNNSGYTHIYNNAYQADDNSYHYISQNSLGASKYELAFGSHNFDTAPSGTRGNNITWTTKMRVNHDGISFGGGNNPNVFAEFYMSGQAGDSTDEGADWANNGILQLNNASGSSAGSEILILGTHSGGKGQIASGIGFKRNNSSDWGTSLTFRTHSAATSNIDELNEVMRIHGTGQVTICEPNQGHTPSSTHRIRVSGGTVQSGGIELLQHAVSGSYGVYNTGIRHHAWNEVGKTNRYSNMVHTRYHCEKVWVKTFANGVANQQVRIQFPDYSTWTNGFIYIHTTYSNGNASGLLGYLFTHNANGGSNYNKSLTQIYDIGSTNSHYSMSNSWSFKSWGNNGGHNGENTHALEIRRDGSNAGNGVKIHLVIVGDQGSQYAENAYLTEGSY